MKPQKPKTPRQELEASLTALLLGELPAEKAAALRELMLKDAELARLYERLETAIGLVKETAAVPEEQPAGQPEMKLSENKREQLLAHFKTLTPREFEKPMRREVRVRELAVAAGIVGFVGIAAALFFQTQSAFHSASNFAHGDNSEPSSLLYSKMAKPSKDASLADQSTARLAAETAFEQEPHRVVALTSSTGGGAGGIVSPSQTVFDKPNAKIRGAVVVSQSAGKSVDNQIVLPAATDYAVSATPPVPALAPNSSATNSVDFAFHSDLNRQGRFDMNGSSPLVASAPTKAQLQSVAEAEEMYRRRYGGVAWEDNMRSKQGNVGLTESAVEQPGQRKPEGATIRGDVVSVGGERVIDPATGMPVPLAATPTQKTLDNGIDPATGLSVPAAAPAADAKGKALAWLGAADTNELFTPEELFMKRPSQTLTVGGGTGGGSGGGRVPATAVEQMPGLDFQPLYADVPVQTPAPSTPVTGEKLAEVAQEGKDASGSNIYLGKELAKVEESLKQMREVADGATAGRAATPQKGFRLWGPSETPPASASKTSTPYPSGSYYGGGAFGGYSSIRPADPTNIPGIDSEKPPTLGDLPGVGRAFRGGEAKTPGDLGLANGTNATRERDAALYFEMGKLDEAEALFKQAAKEDPDNRTADYYLNLIKDSRYRKQLGGKELVTRQAMVDTEKEELNSPSREILPTSADTNLVAINDSSIPLGGSFTNAVAGITTHDGDQFYRWNPTLSDLNPGTRFFNKGDSPNQIYWTRPFNDGAAVTAQKTQATSSFGNSGAAATQPNSSNVYSLGVVGYNNPSNTTFTDRLKSAGDDAQTYDRYTFYRNLSQLGVEGEKEPNPKLALSYSNVQDDDRRPASKSSAGETGKIDVSGPSEFVSEVIPFKYAKASEIASALNSLSSGGGGGATVGGSTTTRATGGFGRTGTGANYGSPSTPQTNVNPAADNSFTNRLRGIVNRAANAGETVVFGQTKMIPDERSNSLLLYASRDDMKTIKDIIAKLDVDQAQGKDRGTRMELVSTYEQKKRELEEAQRSQQVLNMKLAAENVESSIPKTTMVEIMDDAAPAEAKKTDVWDRIRGKGKYESLARIKVERDESDVPFATDATKGGNYDPYFIQLEFETIKSDRVLSNVVAELNLQKEWSKNGPALTTNEAIALLKQKLDLRPERNTSFVDIRAKSDKPEEAAQLANAVARSYQGYRQEIRRQLSLGGIAALQERSKEQEVKVANAQREVDRLHRELAINEAKAAASQPAPNQPAPSQVDAAPAKPAVPPLVPQPEVQTRENAFSTFSLNVSDVAFKLAAASLEKGQMPEPASIRSEEFINAFDYRDPEAPAGVPVGFSWERARYPYAQNRDLLRFSIKTAAQGRQAGRPLNLVLLLDNSGSMERADRVAIIREALKVLASQLQLQDKLSVITFARTAQLRVDGVAGSQAAQVAEDIGGLTPEGGTNIEEAMNLAYQTALRHYLANGINRVVLLTDGAANLGNVEPESLKQKVEANRKQGVALDCFGIGWEGFNDDLLETLSRNGDGRYGFINSPEEATTDFAGQLAGALNVAASDVKVQVEFNPARVTAYRQIGYAKHQLTKEQFRDNTVDAAEIAAQEAGNALYVIEVNPAGQGPLGTVRVRFKIPGTSDYREHEWSVPFNGSAVALEQASPAMRLSATASAFSEWLASSPYATEVTPDTLLRYLGGVPEVYGADGRPKRLEWMIRQAKSIAGGEIRNSNIETRSKLEDSKQKEANRVQSP